MDASNIARMANFLRVAAAAASMDPADVQSGPESVGIVGTGVDVSWSKDALGRGKPGWEVRVTYHVSDLGASGAGRTATDVLAAYGQTENFAAARQAVMSIVQRRIEAALADAV